MHTAAFLLIRLQERSSFVKFENYSFRARSQQTKNTVWSEQHRDFRPEIVSTDELLSENEIAIFNRQLVETLKQGAVEVLRELIIVATQQLRKPNIASATLKRVLTPKQFIKWKHSLVDQVDSAEVLYGNGCPEDLRNYGQKVARADFMYGKADRMSGKREFSGYKYSFSAIEKAYSAAESEYEDAVEYLQELWSIKAPQDLFEIECWLDRPVSWTTDNYPSLDPHGVPRVRGSRSVYVEAYLPKLHKKMKREHCILDVLTDAIEELIYVYENPLASNQLTIENKEKLSSLLIKLKNKN